MSMIRSIVRARAPMRGPPGGKPVPREPIDPRSPNFPYRHRELGGYFVWPGQAPYSIIEGLKGNQPIIGHMYKSDYLYGKVYKPTYDINRHFSCIDRYATIPKIEMLKYAFLWGWTLRIFLFSPVFVFCSISCLVWIEYRREPLEIFVDRDEYFKNFDSFYYGVYVDHHAFSHMLAARRANKWGYHDVTLEHAHH